MAVSEPRPIAPMPTEESATSATPSPADRRRPRVALVGAGYVAQFHRDVLAEMPEVELAAVCDADPERARSAARQWDVAAAVTSIDELAGLGIDVAHVLVPPDLH